MNSRAQWAVAALSAAFLILPPAAAAPVQLSKEWAGTWRLDLSGSKFESPVPKRETRTIAVTGNTMSVRSIGVDASGKTIDFNYSVRLGGTFHPLVGSPHGDQISMRLVDPRKVAVQVTHNGKPSATASTEVSGDRLTMDRRRLKPAGGTTNDLLVYDRVH